MLRSYFKAGRWNILKSQAFTPIIDAYVSMAENNGWQ